MTISEIEKALGYSIKIVKENQTTRVDAKSTLIFYKRRKQWQEIVSYFTEVFMKQ